MTTRPSSPSSLPEELPPKRQELGVEKVCIFCLLDWFDPDFYHMYIVDRAEKVEKVSRLPALRFDHGYPISLAFAVVKSTLYMFGGLGDKGGDKWYLSSHSYSLSNITETGNLNVSKDSLTEITSMQFKKFGPKAAVMGDGRICVFSTVLAHWSKLLLFDMGLNDPNFEIYDPVKNKWSLLPEPFVYSDGDECSVDTYLVENSNLFIFTDKRGSWRIDLHHPGDWVRFDMPAPIRKCASLKVGELLLKVDAYGAYNFTTMGQLQPFRSSPVKEDFQGLIHYPFSDAITILPNKDKNLGVCTVQLALSKNERKPTVLVDFFKFDRAQLFDRKELSTTDVSSRVFYLIYCQSISILGVFPIDG